MKRRSKMCEHSNYFSAEIWALQTQMVGNKVVADCVEALIGAHYVGGDEVVASAFMRRIGLLPPLPIKAHLYPEPDRTSESNSSR